MGDVRSIGLFSTIELVKDRETKEPLAPLPGLPSSPEDAQVAPRLSAALRERGMHCFVKWNHLFPIPPLCINETELRDGLHILDEVLDIADEMVPGDVASQGDTMAERYDVIIVGGGMLGLSTAYHLARREARILLLQAGDLGGGSSAACSGRAQVAEGHLDPLNIRLIREGLARLEDPRRGAGRRL